MPVINEKKVKNFLDTALETIRTEADPQLLNQYRSLIRKNVSFFRRSYLAAYLLMLQEQPQGRRRGAEPAAHQKQRSAQQPPAFVPLPEHEAVKLFINIGRNRRVFPREILGLIGTRTSVPKEDIGTISILNNYSFIQVRSSAAPEILESLNGASFRGRTLTVNYARGRKEDDEYPLAEPTLNDPEEDGVEDGDGEVYGAGSGVMDSGVYAESGDTDIDDEPGDASMDGDFDDSGIDSDGDMDGDSGDADIDDDSEEDTTG
jgi:hypothetical protein